MTFFSNFRLTPTSTMKPVSLIHVLVTLVETVSVSVRQLLPMHKLVENMEYAFPGELQASVVSNSFKI